MHTFLKHLLQQNCCECDAYFSISCLNYFLVLSVLPVVLVLFWGGGAFKKKNIYIFMYCSIFFLLLLFFLSTSS